MSMVMRVSRQGRGDGLRAQDRRGHCPRRCSRRPGRHRGLPGDRGSEPARGRPSCAPATARSTCSTTSTSRSRTREIVVVLGANGAGKTTTMRAISGTIPRAGQIAFAGTPSPRRRADAIVRAGIAQVPQGRGTFPELTVEDNLRIGAYTPARRRGRRRHRPLVRDVPAPEGTAATSAPAASSGGEQQMLAIARALMSRPKLLLCDEPSLGLAPLITQELFGIIATAQPEEGIAVLLVEQNANLAMQIAHRVYLLETGRIVASGDAETIARRRHHPQGVPGVLMDRLLRRPRSSACRQGGVRAGRPRPRHRLPRHRPPQLRPGRDGHAVGVHRRGSFGRPGHPARRWPLSSAWPFGFLLGATDGGHADPARSPRSHRSPCSSSPSACSSASTRSRRASGAQRCPTRRRQRCSPTIPTTSPHRRHRVAATRTSGILVVDARRHRAAVPAVPEDALRPRHARRGQQPRLGAARRHPDRAASSPARGASPAHSVRSAA